MNYPESRREAQSIGVMYYFTGRACTHGHISIRLTSTGQCTECLRKRSKAQWSDPAIREKKISQLEKYREKTRDPEYQSDYRKRTEVKERLSRSNKKSHERLSRCPEFRKKKARAASEWVDKNRERHNLNQSARRNRLRASGSFSADQVIELIKKQNNRCASPECRARISCSGKRDFHIDHIVPVSKGGSNDIYNIQCLCPDCNLRKHNKMPDVWAKENWRLV